MKRRSLIFLGPEQTAVCEENFAGPAAGEVLVRTRMSAISPGTEMLAYGGHVPQHMALDEKIGSLQESFTFPFKYGYACVGVVEETGAGVAPGWRGRRVFSFHPHESAFTAATEELIPIADDISLENAIFLANMETAVNFVLDGRPLIGESVGVFGLGIVGLLTTALLARFPLAALVAFDRYPARRAAALELGVSASIDPAAEDAIGQARALMQERGRAEGADLVYEISGSPRALDQAIGLAGFDARVVIGSWYGDKPVELDLGGRFHRSRIRLMGSQVSTVTPELGGRWSKARRLGAAWDALRAVNPARWITQRFALSDAPSAYQLLAERPQDTIQVVLEYG
jgi:2-desacetyl-2-hydroxyethyl bacteriochlorophyllide A dehydrogenase